MWIAELDAAYDEEREGDYNFSILLGILAKLRGSAGSYDPQQNLGAHVCIVFIPALLCNLECAGAGGHKTMPGILYEQPITG